MPYGMKVLAPGMALKATRKTIKLAGVGEGSGAPLPTVLQSRSDGDPPTTTWQSRWPKE
jgi:hypothetical protein